MIHQPERILLAHQLEAHCRHLSGDLLDIGCGRVKRYAHLVTCTSYTTLDVVAENEPDILASATAMTGVADARFDAILCTQVLEHLNSPQKALDEMKRVLKPGGTALLTFPQWNELHEEPHDYYRYTKYGFIHMAEQSGFEIVVLEQRGRFFSVLGQMVIRYMIDRHDLYGIQNRVAASLVGRLSKLVCHFAIACDGWFPSPASDKHALGYLAIVRKA